MKRGFVTSLALAALAVAAPAATLADVAAESTSAAALLAGDQSALLDAAIAEYAALRDRGGWNALSDEANLRPGVRHIDVRELRQRLRLSNDFQGEVEADPLLFDIALVDALKHFQRRHGLRVSGIVDSKTLASLNLPVEHRLAQLEYSRTAWAELQLDQAERRVWVNIPEAVVAAVTANHVDLAMRAVVGHPGRPTPRLSSQITAIVLNPPWNVPRTIAVQDLLPRQQSDPQFFSSKNIRVLTSADDGLRQVDSAGIDWNDVNEGRFPYRLRQEPGPWNSLGRYKFDFANRFNVFLHDTPAPGLLELSARSLSSGCVRLEDPAALAQWLSTETAANRLERLTATLEDNRTRRITLSASVAIDTVYLVAWVAADSGVIQFRQDVYRRGQSN